MSDSTAVGAYGSGPSPLMKLVEQNSKTLESVAGLLAQLTQSMQTMTGGANKQENKPSDKGQVWPGSNYRGKNFIPNYKHPSQQDQQQQSQQQYGAAQDQNRGSQQAAQQATGAGITETIRLSLENMSQKKAYGTLLELRGSYKSSLSLDDLREDR